MNKSGVTFADASFKSAATHTTTHTTIIPSEDYDKFKL